MPLSSFSLSRRQFNKTAAVAAASLTLPFSQTLTAQNTSGIRGQFAPELTVDHWIDGEGRPRKPFSVTEHRGKWVYLKCFQEWCPACHSTGFPNLQKLMEAFPNGDKVVAAVIQTTFEGHRINNADALRKNQKRYGLNLPFGHDPGNTDLPSNNAGHYPSTMLSYRTGGTPWLTLINPEGIVVYDGHSVNMAELIKFLKTA